MRIEVTLTEVTVADLEKLARGLRHVGLDAEVYTEDEPEVPTATVKTQAAEVKPLRVVRGAAEQPVVEAPAPVVEAPAPVVEAPAPVVEAPAPVVEAPAPVVEAPAPVVEAPAPVVEAPAPVVQLDTAQLEMVDEIARLSGADYQDVLDYARTVDETELHAQLLEHRERAGVKFEPGDDEGTPHSDDVLEDPGLDSLRSELDLDLNELPASLMESSSALDLVKNLIALYPADNADQIREKILRCVGHVPALDPWKNHNESGVNTILNILLKRFF